MTAGSTFEAILFATIPVTAMLFIEVVLPYLKKRRRTVVLAEEDVNATARLVESDQTQRDISPTKRWRQDGRYYRILHQTANMGNLASMDNLGELALVRKDYTEAFYWRLMMELLGTPSPGFSARGICQAWVDAKCPQWHPAEGGLFTEKQAMFARTVLDLWSGRHLQIPLKAIRKMARDHEKEACLFVKRFGIGEFES